jgi:response regulator RpfG family c-di-GMP phosphodiesterase
MLCTMAYGTDLQMPGMDGFEVEGLKEIETDGDLPVLVIIAQPGHKLRALQSGAKDFIRKPFDRFEVLTRIHNMLEMRLLHKEARNYSKVLEQTVQERTADLRESEARFTDQKHAEEKLHENEAMLRLIMENITGLVAIVDTEGARLAARSKELRPTLTMWRASPPIALPVLWPAAKTKRRLRMCWRGR